MDDVLGKPIQLSKLGAAVRHWMVRGRARAAAGRSAGTDPAAAVDAGVLARTVGDDTRALAGIRIAYLRRSWQGMR